MVAIPRAAIHRLQRIQGLRLAHVSARLGYHSRCFRASFHPRYLLANLICGVLPDYASGVVRARVYRLAGFRIGHGAYLMANLDLRGVARDFADRLVIGADAMIADHVSIALDAKVTIGCNVAIAPHVVIHTGTHQIGPGSARLGACVTLPVTIEDGAWIRIGAIIAPGVTVGRGSIVAAGAVVLKDVPPNTYAEGNPAQVVRRLPWGDR